MTVPRTLKPDDDVPIDSIIVDDDGNAYQLRTEDAYQLRSRKRWHSACVWNKKTYSLSFLILNYGPITLIWEPTTTKDN